MASSRALQASPALVLTVGALLLFKVHGQREMPLRTPLAAVPAELLGYTGQDLSISPEEIRIAGMNDYLMRLYEKDSSSVFSLYVGYYRSQASGKSIHSPKNCLPGGGWEPVRADTAAIGIGPRNYVVNRYLLEKEGQRVLVLYWYQGRGRVAWNEYGVKWDLLRDKALHGRSEEALVRIVVPLWKGLEEPALATAVAVAREVIPTLELALPGGP